MSEASSSGRVFKTAWFRRAARKAHLLDEELCLAIQQLRLGQGDDLGGGVFKKRLRKNQYRTIILAQVGRHWIFAYFFAKQDRANIDDEELVSFRRLAKAFAQLTDTQVSLLVNNRDWGEICHEKQA